MEREEVKKILSFIKTLWPQSFTDMSEESSKIYLSIWHDALKTAPSELAFKAVKDIAYNSTREFAPTVGQVRARMAEIAKGETLTADEAWIAVRTALRLFWMDDREHDKKVYDALPEEVKKIYTISELLTMANDSAANNDTYKKPQFLKAYDTISKNAQIAMLESGDFGLIEAQKVKAIGTHRGDENG